MCVEKCEPEVDLILSYCADTPLDVVIPETLVKMVQNLDWEDLMWVEWDSIGQCPILPEWCIDHVEAVEGLGLFDIYCEVPWID